MTPDELIQECYPPGTKGYEVYMRHADAVAQKAVSIGRKLPHLKANLSLLEEAARLHDIGIFLTHAPNIECFGTMPYLCHGFLGRFLLEKYGFTEIAPVCERHVGSGLTRQYIWAKRLPLPVRDMLPRTIEEKIVCYADKFFSKTGKIEAKPVDQIIEKLGQHGKEVADRFVKLQRLLEPS